MYRMLWWFVERRVEPTEEDELEHAVRKIQRVYKHKRNQNQETRKPKLNTPKHGGNTTLERKEQEKFTIKISED